MAASCFEIVDNWAMEECHSDEILNFLLVENLNLFRFQNDFFPLSRLSLEQMNILIFTQNSTNWTFSFNVPSTLYSCAFCDLSQPFLPSASCFCPHFLHPCHRLLLFSNVFCFFLCPLSLSLSFDIFHSSQQALFLFFYSAWQPCRRRR